MADKINGIPKTEQIWIKRTTLKGEIFYITSKESNRSYYFLYKMEEDKAVKLGKSKSPVELERKYIDGEKNDQ